MDMMSDYSRSRNAIKINAYYNAYKEKNILNKFSINKSKSLSKMFFLNVYSVGTIYRRKDKSLYSRQSFSNYRKFKYSEFDTIKEFIQIASDPNYNEYWKCYNTNIKMSFYKQQGGKY